jgi:hypothetical protein
MKNAALLKQFSIRTGKSAAWLRQGQVGFRPVPD